MEIKVANVFVVSIKSLTWCLFNYRLLYVIKLQEGKILKTQCTFYIFIRNIAEQPTFWQAVSRDTDYLTYAEADSFSWCLHIWKDATCPDSLFSIKQKLTLSPSGFINSLAFLKRYCGLGSRSLQDRENEKCHIRKNSINFNDCFV